MHERNHELLDIKIKQYLIPAIMMKLALQLGNVVDAMLVGNLLGTGAMSAVSLSIPVLSLIQIPGFFLGNGGAIAAGILLGRRQKKEAKEVFTSTFLAVLFGGLIFFLAAFFATQPLAALLSGGGTLQKDVASYVFVCLAGAPVVGMGLWLSSFLAGDSHPQLSSAYFIISNVVNLILDFVFLKYTALGVTGAALSTMLGCTVGFVVLVPYIKSTKRMLSFAMPHLSADIVKSIVSAGTPHLSFLIVMMIKTVIMNGIVLSLLGESGMAVFTVCNNTGLILAMFIGGIFGVIPNIAGILYGEKDYYGIHALIHKLVRYGAVMTGILMLIVAVFTKGFTLMFGIKDPFLSQTVISVLRVYVFAMPFNMWNYFGLQYYGSVERSELSTLITTLQNGVFLIPAAYFGIIAGQHIGGSGYLGLAFAFVISEALTVTVSTVFRKVKYKESSYLLIPEKNPGVCLDFTLPSGEDEVPKVPREIRGFCEENGVEPTRANMIAICAEEMVINTVKYGGEASKWIDVCLTIDSEALILRLRDNGVPFDPSTYQYDDNDDFEIHGIELARKAAKDITYVRAIDLNNTTVLL